MSLLGDLKSVVCDRLRADMALALLLGDGERIFDIPPRPGPDALAASCPYVYVGAVGGQSEQQHGAALRFNARLRLYCVADEGDRERAHEIAQAVCLALQNTALPMAEGHAMELMWIENVGDVVDPLEAQMVFVDLRCLCQLCD